MGQRGQDLVALRVMLTGCSRRNLDSVTTCMNSTEAEAYFKGAKFKFVQPKTYLDYEDLEDPLKSVAH